MDTSSHDPVPFRPHVAGTQPPYDAPPYRSTGLRHPSQPLVKLPHTVTETTGPRFTAEKFPAVIDISVADGRAAIGERIIVEGRVLDEDGRPVPETMIEIWQANAAGRYHHPRDQHDAPLDGNFRGTGRVFSDEDGIYRFYHQSFKVYYRLQPATLKIVEELQALAPHLKLNADFMQIIADGTGNEFKQSHNKNWSKHTRPIVEAFFHARHMLEMVCKYADELAEPPQVLPSGWATFLYLYNLR